MLNLNTCTLVLLPLYFMARGKTIPEDLHWVVIRLGSGTTMTEDEIAMYTDISVRSVRKILAFFRRTGGVDFPQKQIAPPQLHKSLCDYDIEVCITPFFAIVDQ
jgi:transcription initiation factor IIE alpha subunit